MEQPFTNHVIETTALPEFESVQLTPLHRLYWKVILFNLLVTFVLLGSGCAAFVYFTNDVQSYWYIFASIYVVALLLTFAVSHIGYKNSGYAFRDHDVIYRNGAVSITTTIIPYNRVQHAAIHEGFIARKLGIATIEIFTAGGVNSDIKIPGVEKQHAENIKQLLMGKILNQSANDE